jgi:hypothetical protein
MRKNFPGIENCAYVESGKSRVHPVCNPTWLGGTGRIQSILPVKENTLNASKSKLHFIYQGMGWGCEMFLTRQCSKQITVVH